MQFANALNHQFQPFVTCTYLARLSGAIVADELLINKDCVPYYNALAHSLPEVPPIMNIECWRRF
jgi:hypothetical protein